MVHQVVTATIEELDGEIARTAEARLDEAIDFAYMTPELMRTACVGVVAIALRDLAEKAAHRSYICGLHHGRELGRMEQRQPRWELWLFGTVAVTMLVCWLAWGRV